jgi:hypothetical protein
MSISDFINDPFGAAGNAMADLAPDSVRETVHEAKETVQGVAESATNPSMPDAGAMTQAYADGHTETTLADGTFVEKHANHTDTIGADGTRTTTFADGSFSTVNPDGSIVEGVADQATHGAVGSHPDIGTAGDFTDSSFDLGSYADEHGIAGPDLKSASGIIVDDKENWDTNVPTEQSQPYIGSASSGTVHPDPYADGTPQPMTVGEQAQGYGAGGPLEGADVPGDIFGDAGTLGEVTAPESYSLGENTFGGMVDTTDQIIHPDPYAPPEPPNYEVEIGPAQVIDPEDGTVGQQAQGVGADGPWGTSDYGGSAANDASGTGAEGVYDDGTQGPNWTADPNAGTEGPATPDYGPGATGQLAGAEGEAAVEDYGIF